MDGFRNYYRFGFSLPLFTSEKYSFSICENYLSGNSNSICGGIGNFVFSFTLDNEKVINIQYFELQTCISMIQHDGKQNIYFLDNDGIFWTWKYLKNENPIQNKDLPRINSFSIGKNLIFLVGFDGSLWFNGEYDKELGFGLKNWNEASVQNFSKLPGFFDVLNVFCDSTYHQSITFLLCKNGKLYTMWNLSPKENDRYLFEKSYHFYEICPFSNVISIFISIFEIYFLLDNGMCYCASKFLHFSLHYISNDVKIVRKRKTGKKETFFINSDCNLYLKKSNYPPESVGNSDMIIMDLFFTDNNKPAVILDSNFKFFLYYGETKKLIELEEVAKSIPFTLGIRKKSAKK